jgi:hypothetical protein
VADRVPWPPFLDRAANRWLDDVNATVALLEENVDPRELEEALAKASEATLEFQVAIARLVALGGDELDAKLRPVRRLRLRR